jgi:hypothetical protein
MGRITRRKQIIVPDNYWESSSVLNIDWVYVNA